MGIKEKNAKNIREGFSMDASGSLAFDHCDLKIISQKYGTPCYVYSENLIRKKCQEYKQAFSRNQVDFEILYTSKAFLVKAMAHILDDESLSLDVASAGEIAIALSANFPPEKIYFHGNNKSKEEIEYALKKGIGTIMVDNEFELDTIEEMAKKINTNVKIIIRIIPGIDAHTHKHM